MTDVGWTDSLDLALTPGGAPAIAFHDHARGALRLASKSSGGWQVEIVEEGPGIKTGDHVLEIERRRTPVALPFVNGTAERAIKSTRLEMLNRVRVRDVEELQWYLDEYKTYYNEHRANQAIGGRTPAAYGRDSPGAEVISLDESRGSDAELQVGPDGKCHCLPLVEMTVEPRMVEADQGTGVGPNEGQYGRWPPSSRFWRLPRHEIDDLLRREIQGPTRPETTAADLDVPTFDLESDPGTGAMNRCRHENGRWNQHGDERPLRQRSLEGVSVDGERTNHHCDAKTQP